MVARLDEDIASLGDDENAQPEDTHEQKEEARWQPDWKTHRRRLRREPGHRKRVRGDMMGVPGHEAGIVLLDNPRTAAQAAARVRRNP